jgi:hypothetical protein
MLAEERERFKNSVEVLWEAAKQIAEESAQRRPAMLVRIQF